MTLPKSWHDAFIEFRKNNDKLNAGRAEKLAKDFRDKDWKAIEDESSRWENVKGRSAIARSSLDLYGALKAQR